MVGLVYYLWNEHPFLRAAYIFYAHLTAASTWRISCKFIYRDVVARRQRQIYIRSPSWLRDRQGRAQLSAAEDRQGSEFVSTVQPAPVEQSVGSLNRKLGRSPKRPTNALRRACWFLRESNGCRNPRRFAHGSLLTTYVMPRCFTKSSSQIAEVPSHT